MLYNTTQTEFFFTTLSHWVALCYQTSVFSNIASFLFGHLMHGVGEVVHVGGGNASHGHAAVLGQVDAKVLGDLLHLKTRNEEKQN